MGLSAREAWSKHLHDSPLPAFPSPAGTFTPDEQQSKKDSVQCTPCDDTLQNILPGDVKLEPVMTSPLPTTTLTETLEPGMDTLVGGALAPVHDGSIHPHFNPNRTAPAFRLPCFEALGIAARKPDVGVSPSPPTSRGFARATFVPCYTDVLTPPTEAGASELEDNFLSHVAGASSPAMDAGVSAMQGAEAGGESTVDAMDTTPIAGPIQGDVGGRERTFLDDAARVILQNIHTAPVQMDSLKVLSHALPSPSTFGHMFPSIINILQDTTAITPAAPVTWINVFHAIPGRYKLADIPTSPPATPGPSIGGDDYFTQKVFDSAVSIADYQEDLSALPRSPLPIVQPGSIDLSIVERYIPPSTVNEFAGMCSFDGPSILIDRLVELSPNNGTLLFIYPTRTGAQTFIQEYLGPIIDPITRKMSFLHDLSSDLSRILGNMPAVDHLPDYDTVRRRIDNLCTRLTHRDTAARRFHSDRSVFSLAYSASHSVVLSRQAWARDWWTKQEKERIRETVRRLHKEAQYRIGSRERSTTTPTELAQQILDGVAEKQQYQGGEPQVPVEVSVFVIRRSRQS